MYLVESSIRRPNKVSFCVAVPPESEGDHVVTLPATPALSLYHHGAYEDLPAAEKKLRAYARRHELTPTGKLLNPPLFFSLEKPASFDAGFSISVFRTGRPSRGRSSPAS